MDWSFNWREKLEPERINSELTELKSKVKVKRESDKFGRCEACILKWKHKPLFSVLLLQHPNAARSFNPTIETDEKLVWIYGNHH